MTHVVAGVDGCPSGWLRITRDATGRLAARVFESSQQLFSESREFRVLTIDIPIGLMDDGPRECDLAARRLLGKRSSSVFPAPVRAVLDATDYRDACERSEAARGVGLSQQTWAIVPRIREVDNVLRADEELRRIVREVHPEVSFAFCNNEQPMEHAKRTGFGFAERVRLLESHFGAGFDALRKSIPLKDAGDDDILDAAVALWSAERIRDQLAVSLPATPPHDRMGLPMCIMA